MNDEFKNVTRGGQTFLHSMRMVSQIFKILLTGSLSVGLLVGILCFLEKTNAYDRYLYAKWGYAKVMLSLNPKSTMLVKNPTGKTVKLYCMIFVHSSFVQDSALHTGKQVKAALWWSSGGFVLNFILMGLWFKNRGKRLEKTSLLKGTFVVEPKILNALIKKTGKLSDLQFGGINLYEGAERQHFLIHGSTGTGKSVLIKDMLDQLRAKNAKAIVYDKHGSFVQHYYNPNIDKILNPLDERCVPWDIWAECKDAADFDSMATALMPMPAQSMDPFWINAARSIFACVAFKMKTQSDRTNKKLLSYLFTEDLESLGHLLKGTEAEALVSEKSGKTALSVKSVLAAYLKSLKYLKECKQAFSIRDWVSDDKQTGWLFISSRADKHESLKPLISSWLDVAANALMSLPEDPDRRLWLVIDELPSLQRLPYLPEAFAESRKFGGCLVAGLQNYFQLQKIYGADGAKEIVDLCNIRAYFSSPSHDAANWVAREIGAAEQLESREGISYGANTVRDGVTLSHQQTSRLVVTASEIGKMPNLTCFISIPPLMQTSRKWLSKKRIEEYALRWPIAKVALKWKKRETLQPAFVEKKETETFDEPLAMQMLKSEKGFLDRPFSSVKKEEKQVEEDLFREGAIEL